MHYVTKGTCSRAIDFDVVDGKVTNTKFTMGCMGNIDCGGRGTSCPDQLAKALEQYLEENK